MPELPEVERAAKRLRDAAVGKTIVGVRVLHRSLARALPPRTARRLVGRIVARVERRAKHQLVHLDDDSVLVVHFRMNGDWHIGRAGDPIVPATRAVLTFDDGTVVALTDSRALATLTHHQPGELRLPPLGPEPFEDAFDGAYLGATLRMRRGPIKPVLLDQRVVGGVGNIYASEALWLARMSPAAKASALSAARRELLVASLREVLRQAPAARYSDDAGQAQWNVYDREGEPCRRCGSRIRRIVQAGRSTFYCPRCQRR